MKASLFFKRGFAGPAALKTFLFSLFLIFGQWAWGQVTVTHNFTAISGNIDANISFISIANLANTPAFNTDHIRLYSKRANPGAGDGNELILTPSNGAIITGVSIVKALSSDNPSSVTYSVNGGTRLNFPNSVTGISANSSFSIKNQHTGGSDNLQLRISSITITYTIPSSCTSPATQASAFSSSAIAQTTATVGWTRGNGDNVLVVARAGAAVNADPASGTSYSANSAFGSGTQIGTGNFVVYNGAGNSVNLTGLTAGTTYHFAVYEYNTTGICYNTTELTGNLTTASAPSLTATGTLNEGTLNGATVNFALANTSFADATLSAANFTLNNAPAGVSIQSVAYVSATSATITLAYNNTDFDTNVTNFNVTINGSELTSASNLTSNNLIVTAVTETLALSSGNLVFGTVCNGSFGDQTFTISGTNLKAGTINLSAIAGYTYAESLGGSAITGFSQLGGTLATKTIYVRLTPTAPNQTYNGTITVSGGAAPNVTKNVSGNSNITAQSVTTDINSANNVDYRSANLRASATT